MRNPPDLAVRGGLDSTWVDPAYAPSRDGMIAMMAGRLAGQRRVMAQGEKATLAPGEKPHKVRDRTTGRLHSS